MTLRVVGAGLGRTGTHSLKVALEQLLGGPCYHMLEVFQHPDHVPLWHRAIKGNPPEWDLVFSEYTAALDWPEAALWEEVSDAYPDAVVLLSVRESPEAWWTSVSETIFKIMEREPPGPDPWYEMANAMLDDFTPGWREPETAMAAYERHNALVRARAEPDRLAEWKPGDGWAPICDRLG